MKHKSSRQINFIDTHSSMENVPKFHGEKVKYYIILFDDDETKMTISMKMKTKKPFPLHRFSRQPTVRKRYYYKCTYIRVCV